jgi:hypothetical protein
MALVLKFGYPLIAMWLSGEPEINLIAGKRRFTG